jgi:hypothetical protein
MPIEMTPASIYRRLKQVGTDMSLARSPLNWFSFAVLGLTRGYLPGPLVFLHRLYSSELIVRPASFDGLRLPASRASSCCEECPSILKANIDPPQDGNTLAPAYATAGGAPARQR